jgi:multiple sugar transport system substrate-binding protein
MPTLSRRQLLASALGAAVFPAFGNVTKQRLVVAAFPLVVEIIRQTLPAWQQANPGVEVEILSRQYDDHHTAMTTALSTSGGTRPPDVMALETMYMGRFSLGAGLQNLSQAPFEAEALRERFVPFAIEQARNRDGAIVALPTDIGPSTLLYRVDVLERAGMRLADLTASWEAYVEGGVELKARTGAYLLAHARYLKDFLIGSATPAGQNIYFDGQGRPSVESALFRRAFELCRRLRQLGLDAVVDTWRNDWTEHLRRGRLATELSGAWMAGQMAAVVAPGTKGLWRATQLPGNSFAAHGGTYYSIPRRSDPAKKALAWSLIQAMTLDRNVQLRAFKNQDAFPALMSAHTDPFFDQPVEFLGGQLARQLWRESAHRVPARPLHRQQKFAEEVVNGELDNVLIFGKSIDQALADARDVLLHHASR